METKIQELRKANKISQAELADEMGVTRQTIICLLYTLTLPTKA